MTNPLSHFTSPPMFGLVEPGERVALAPSLIMVRQADNYGCGTAALSMAMSYAGCYARVSDIDRDLRAPGAIVAPQAMMHYARRQGCNSTIINHASIVSLSDWIASGAVPIVLMRGRKDARHPDHYAIVSAIETQADGLTTITLRDPATGSDRHMWLTTFSKAWSGSNSGIHNFVVVVAPAAIPLPRPELGSATEAFHFIGQYADLAHRLGSPRAARLAMGEFMGEAVFAQHSHLTTVGGMDYSAVFSPTATLGVTSAGSSFNFSPSTWNGGPAFNLNAPGVTYSIATGVTIAPFAQDAIGYLAAMSSNPSTSPRVESIRNYQSTYENMSAAQKSAFKLMFGVDVDGVLGGIHAEKDLKQANIQQQNAQAAYQAAAAQAAIDAQVASAAAAAQAAVAAQVAVAAQAATDAQAAAAAAASAAAAQLVVATNFSVTGQIDQAGFSTAPVAVASATAVPATAAPVVDPIDNAVFGLMDAKAVAMFMSPSGVDVGASTVSANQVTDGVVPSAVNVSLDQPVFTVPKDLGSVANIPAESQNYSLASQIVITGSGLPVDLNAVTVGQDSQLLKTIIDLSSSNSIPTSQSDAVPVSPGVGANSDLPVVLSVSDVSVGRQPFEMVVDRHLVDRSASLEISPVDPVASSGSGTWVPSAVAEYSNDKTVEQRLAEGQERIDQRITDTRNAYITDIQQKTNTTVTANIATLNQGVEFGVLTLNQPTAIGGTTVQVNESADGTRSYFVNGSEMKSMTDQQVSDVLGQSLRDSPPQSVMKAGEWGVNPGWVPNSPDNPSVPGFQAPARQDITAFEPVGPSTTVSFGGLATPIETISNDVVISADPTFPSPSFAGGNPVSVKVEVVPAIPVAASPGDADSPSGLTANWEVYGLSKITPIINKIAIAGVGDLKLNEVTTKIGLVEDLLSGNVAGFADVKSAGSFTSEMGPYAQVTQGRGTIITNPDPTTGFPYTAKSTDLGLLSNSTHEIGQKFVFKIDGNNTAEVKIGLGTDIGKNDPNLAGVLSGEFTTTVSPIVKIGVGTQIGINAVIPRDPNLLTDATAGFLLDAGAAGDLAMTLAGANSLVNPIMWGANGFKHIPTLAFDVLKNGPDVALNNLNSSIQTGINSDIQAVQDGTGLMWNNFNISTVKPFTNAVTNEFNYGMDGTRQTLGEAKELVGSEWNYGWAGTNQTLSEAKELVGSEWNYGVAGFTETSKEWMQQAQDFGGDLRLGAQQTLEDGKNALQPFQSKAQELLNGAAQFVFGGETQSAVNGVQQGVVAEQNRLEEIRRAEIYERARAEAELMNNFPAANAVESVRSFEMDPNWSPEPSLYDREPFKLDPNWKPTPSLYDKEPFKFDFPAIDGSIYKQTPSLLFPGIDSNGFPLRRSALPEGNEFDGTSQQFALTGQDATYQSIVHDIVAFASGSGDDAQVVFPMDDMANSLLVNQRA